MGLKIVPGSSMLHSLLQLALRKAPLSHRKPASPSMFCDSCCAQIHNNGTSYRTQRNPVLPSIIYHCQNTFITDINITIWIETK